MLCVSLVWTFALHSLQSMHSDASPVRVDVHPTSWCRHDGAHASGACCVPGVEACPRPVSLDSSGRTISEAPVGKRGQKAGRQYDRLVRVSCDRDPSAVGDNLPSQSVIVETPQLPPPPRQECNASYERARSFRAVRRKAHEPSKTNERSHECLRTEGGVAKARKLQSDSQGRSSVRFGL